MKRVHAKREVVTRPNVASVIIVRRDKGPELTTALHPGIHAICRTNYSFTPRYTRYM